MSNVHNSYELVIDLETASVNELYSAVCTVVALSDCMHRFAASPAGELHSVSPEATLARAQLAHDREIAANERFLKWMGFEQEATC